MNEKKKSRINVLLLLVGAAALALFLVFDLDAGDLRRALEQITPGWLLLALGCMLAYYLCDALRYMLIARAFGGRERLMPSLRLALIGFFYSAVTPLASGGQPFQVVYLHRRGMGTGSATSIIAAAYVTFHTALCALGIVGVCLYGGALGDGSLAYYIMFFFGLLCQFCVLIPAILSAVMPQQMEQLGCSLIARLCRARRLRSRQERWTLRWQAFVSEYSESLRAGLHHLPTLLVTLAVSAAEVAAYMSVAYCTFRGLALTGEGYFELMFVQTMLHLAVAFVPLPGASVASEGGFYAVFTTYFGDFRAVGMLLWRLATYYLTLGAGVIALACEHIALRRRAASDPANIN